MAFDMRGAGVSTASLAGRRRLTPAQLAAAAASRERPGSEALDEITIPIDGKVPSNEAPLATTDTLQDFGRILSRARDPEAEERKRRKLDQYKRGIQCQRLTLLRLIKWADADIKTTKDWIIYALRFFRRPPLPRDQELISLARHFFPPRMELRVHVCDFGDNRFDHFEIPLGRIESYLDGKPDWAAVRWIHAPLGLGLVHSSVEEIFLHGGNRGRPFPRSGSPGWPFLETEILNFRSRQDVQNMRDAFIILSELRALNPQLDHIALSGNNNETLVDDIKWRAGHLGTSMGYWNLVESDMPWQLSEGVDQWQSVKDKLAPVGRDVEKQQLSTHPSFRNSQLVRSIFRCFHRADGLLLTLSPSTGVNYLDKNFAKHIEDPVETFLDNDDSSALGHMLQVFADSGTSTWHRKTVEWFLVYLITEIGATPHTVRQGHNSVTVAAAYRNIVQDLKRRRYDEWKRNESVKLVREYLTCIDELTVVSLILGTKLQMFEGLLQDCKALEEEDSERGNAPDNPSGKTAAERVMWAIQHVRNQHDACKRLSMELELAMNALFQLRSIEQNELAIVADSQNKAILVFTGVTIIFLPLSFFTSYFGMNLKGISSTNKDEIYFWKVCGSVGFLIILFITLYAFRSKFRERLMRPVSHGRVVGV
ncbi:hypothetical protein GP486_001354 [Trichoglossum hirsutum]|uniref:Uncharacterized protein n=1 Tax=Trichoglossum hirsutum TaxID=265104 RepID=A0A9P8LH63_9PEZI|nr:hypothetical protein GP486_001354 [Trichoglossum hirsutum]